jgi:hypothetical protein
LDGPIAVIAVGNLATALPEAERRPDPAALRPHPLCQKPDMIGVLLDLLVLDALTLVPPEMLGPSQELRAMTHERFGLRYGLVGDLEPGMDGIEGREVNRSSSSLSRGLDWGS